MGLNYICSNSTYDLTGPEYTTVFDKKKRLNYIVSGTINQLGLTTDTSASVYSPLKFNISGDDYYIGRSTTFNTTASTSTLTTKTATDYYTMYTATRSGSSNGSNSNMTSTSRYLYSTAKTYYARTSMSSRAGMMDSHKNYSFSASITTARYVASTFTASTYFSSKTSDDINDTPLGGSNASGEINGAGTIANKTTSFMASNVMASNTRLTSTKYETYKSSTRRRSTSISISGSTKDETYILYMYSKSSYSTYSASNYTASTYSTRYTSTYTGTISGYNLNATSTKLTYSTREYIYNTSISTTTIDSSHNFV